ncbi:MAG: hypothetical protein BWK79_02585 [Beggiatoa sp. IS2]|nr:MAG: hypothetical protein BWK79_02585 [Beggiatoa sp. IS2]
MSISKKYNLLEKIYESSKSLVYRGIRKEDGLPVVLKILKENYPTSDELLCYHQEHQIIDHLNIKGVIRAYCLEKLGNTLAIVLEDFGGKSLKQFLTEQPLSDLDKFLSIAIQIAESLGDIHAVNLIHKDINPSNIVINPTTQQLKLIDFGIASLLPFEKPVLKNPERLEGTLVYISPEQTGRINRGIDYRTDLYSLGITFYEMLIHKLPFLSQDLLGLIHCHIAVKPVSPHELNTKIPLILSDIVMKLLEKNAEDRYQSAWGLKTDLEKCLQQWRTNGQIELFELAQCDFSGKFQIPQKLYGREQEINTLLQAFERISTPATATGKVNGELMLISGYSGVGKTSLVKEIYKPMTEKRGYFSSGKFEQYQHNIPYSALTQALNEFCYQLLAESDEQIEQWRQGFSMAVGNNGQVLIDVVPNLALIIGQQPEILPVNPIEAQNRFNFVFQNFFRALCQQQHPFILFIDDLQWADLASLNLLKVLMTDPDNQYFMIIGAYRDNEVNATHPLLRLIEELKNAQVIINSIQVFNLSFIEVNTLIADALACNTVDTITLAKLVYEKTQGNAFFTKEFLKSLFQEQLLIFDIQTMKWQWNADQIAVKGITNNVVELLANKIHQLSTSAVKIIQLAACIGNQFDLKTLAIICQRPARTLLPALKHAMIEGLLSPLDDYYKYPEELVGNEINATFKFQHDQIQQAAYSLIAETERPHLHLQMGYLLLENVAETESKLFEIVDHLNLGQSLIDQEKNQVQLIELNLKVALIAKEATAYAAALQYLTVAFFWLKQEAFAELFWQQHYDSALEFHLALAEVEYLNGHFAESESVILQTVARAKTSLEKAKAYHILIIEYTLLARYPDAIETGRKALALLGIELPQIQFEEIRDQEIAKIREIIGNRSIMSLFDLPIMSQPEQKMAVNLLITMGPPCYRSHQRLWSVIVPKVVYLWLCYGHVPQIGYSHTAYGGLLGYVGNDYQTAQQFGQLAQRIMTEIFCNPTDQSVFYLMIGSSLRHWSKHLKYATQDYQEAYNIGVESSNLQYAAYAFGHNMYCRFYQGINLNELLTEITTYLAFSRTRKNQWAIDLLEGGQRVISILNQETQPQMDITTLSEAEYLQRCEIHGNIQVICIFHILKTFALYLQERFDEAWQSFLEADQRIISVATQGLLPWAEHLFNHSLLLITSYQHHSIEQLQCLEQLQINQRQMKIWADSCPENFLHLERLIAAEMARLQCPFDETIDLYDQAIELAKENQFIQHVALANELAAQFCLERGKQKFVKLYLQDAYYAYQLWGATTKVKEIEQKHLKWLERPVETIFSETDTISTSTQLTTSVRLDLDSIMKASQALSQEIILGKLLEKMLQTVIENAGAQRGLFISNQGEHHLTIEAEGTVNPPTMTVLQSLPLEGKVPLVIIHQVIRTREAIVLSDAVQKQEYAQDTYISQHQVKSVLCEPIIYINQIEGLIYLENNLTKGAFTSSRLKILALLSTQIAISLKNAKFVAELEQSRQAAEVANYAKTAFLANMSHELRTPLNGILGYTQILLYDNQLSDMQREGISTIQHSGEYLLTLINDILDFSRMETDHIELVPTEVYLGRFLQNIVELFKKQAEERGLNFHYRPSAHLPVGVYVDEKRLRQILIHLLSNAVKFTQQGGIIFTVDLCGDKIRFQVKDTGVGIAPENLDKIFSPFEKLGNWRNKSTGPGLGLSLTKRLVEIMAGELKIDSVLGQGSTFSVILELPSAVEWKTLSPTTQLLIVGFEGPPRKILIIDDKEKNRLSLLHLLQPLGFELIEACDGQDGLQKAGRYFPHLIITDVVMPRMDGFELVRQLRKVPELQQLPIIVTANSSIEPGQTAAVSYNAFLSHPLQIEQILKLLQEYLKLTWKYETKECFNNITKKVTEPFETPIFTHLTVEQIETLNELTVIGDFIGLTTYLVQLQQAEPALSSFIGEILKLAKKYDKNSIFKLIRAYSSDGILPVE